jgi:signal transduction histidine kinase
MSLGDDPPPDPSSDFSEQLRHELKTPLTAIHARAQLVARMVRRSSSLKEVERGAMLDSLAAVEVAVRAMVPVIDGIGRQSPDDRADAE